MFDTIPMSDDDLYFILQNVMYGDKRRLHLAPNACRDVDILVATALRGLKKVGCELCAASVTRALA